LTWLVVHAILRVWRRELLKRKGTEMTTIKTRDGIDAAELIGQVVQCPSLNLFGVAEYVTQDGFLGIRQPGGRLDEVQANRCQVDPT
jgi:hypothetical protein